MAVVDYRPDSGGFCVEVTTGAGSTMSIRWVAGQSEGQVEGSTTLRENLALLELLSAFGQNELAFRRSRSAEKRESHRQASARHRRDAASLAEMVDALGGPALVAWCSGCFERTTQMRVDGRRRPKVRFVCRNCGTPTAVCAVPRCANHAVLEPASRVSLGYCAAHHHEIPGFEKLTARLSSIEDYRDWLSYDRKNADRITKVGGGTIGAAVVIAPVAFFAAPVVGAALGGSALGGGLSGAAATSHGLAMLGGGSVAAGGLGMAGGTAVVTATGSAVGGILGATATSAYVGSDKSFRIEKLRPGTGPVVLVASGFLSQGQDGWGGWQDLVDRRYPDATVYRVHWGAKELKSLGLLAGVGAGKVAARKVLVEAGKRGSKRFGSLPGIGWVLAAHDVAVNPWTVAKNRAGMTGAILADLIARTDEGPFVLVGHSLGARVMVHAAQCLGTRPASAPRIESMHLLGAAVGRNGDWATLDAAVSGTVWNYFSTRDDVLRTLYKVAELGQDAAGYSGFRTRWPRIKDRNVSRLVGAHSQYLQAVQLS